MKPIHRDISIEELVTDYPGSVRFLIEKGLPCLVCGEPSWGTLEELARSKHWAEEAVAALVEELNEYLATEKAT